LKTLHKILLSSKPHEYVKLNAASTIQKAKNRALATVTFKRKSSEEQNYPKSTRTELLNLCQSQFAAIRRM
ncbi:hypothetical protein T01_10919, partial [Trichinella spiralis]